MFTVLEGQFEFYADRAWLPFHVGETRISLRGNYHAFRNVGPAPGRMMLMTNGGGGSTNTSQTSANSAYPRTRNVWRKSVLTMVTTTCHQREGLDLTYPVPIGALLLGRITTSNASPRSWRWHATDSRKDLEKRYRSPRGQV